MTEKEIKDSTPAIVVKWVGLIEEMDWNKLPDELFDFCVKGIKEVNIVDYPLEWKFYWDNIQHYKTFRESKDQQIIKNPIEPHQYE